jgi:hypothetical protein
MGGQKEMFMKYAIFIDAETFQPLDRVLLFLSFHADILSRNREN